MKFKLHYTPILFLAFTSLSAEGARIKDIAMLKGARSNQLFGYGLVIGLPGTGDKANDLTENSLGLVLKGLGIDLKSQKLETKNAAIVVVSATLPAFMRAGQRLDANVASIGSASSLDGGSLMMTALKGPDGKIYAMAQGKMMVMKRESKGGGGGGNGSGTNLLSAMIPNGATIEREVSWDVSSEKQLRYVLTTPDFTTAVRISKKINDELGGRYAVANDASTVEVMYPYTYETNPVELIAQIESLDVEADRRAKVVINSKTGTVVLGDSVRIAPVAMAHANLKVEVKDQARAVSSEKPLPPDKNATPSDSASEEKAGAAGDAAGGGKGKKVMVLNSGTNISDVVSSLNDMGASADDLVAIMQALKASGALLADVEMQ